MLMNLIQDHHLSNLLLGYSGLFVAFIILSAISLWVVFGIRGRVLLKALLTIFVVWYSIALFFTIQNLSGWPVITTLYDMRKADLYILSIQIRPPSKKDLTDKGVMIFWTAVYVKEDLKLSMADLMNPMKAFDYKYKRDPRAYRIPYDEDLHKEIRETIKKKRRMRGSLMVLKKGKKKIKGGIYKNIIKEKSKFKIINPFELMKK